MLSTRLSQSTFYRVRNADTSQETMHRINARNAGMNATNVVIRGVRMRQRNGYLKIMSIH